MTLQNLKRLAKNNYPIDRNVLVTTLRKEGYLVIEYSHRYKMHDIVNSIARGKTPPTLQDEKSYELKVFSKERQLLFNIQYLSQFPKDVNKSVNEFILSL